MKPTQPKPDGPITKALLDAVQMRGQMLDAGHPAAEVDRLVGVGLKALLGYQRSEPWRFYCEHCRDTGWIDVMPSLAEEALLIRLYGNTTDHQGYASACEPCKWRQMEREKRRKRAGQDEYSDDGLSEAGQVKPKRGFSRFGK